MCPACIKWHFLFKIQSRCFCATLTPKVSAYTENNHVLFFTRKCNSLSYFYKDLLNILVSLSSSSYELQEPFPLSEFKSYADVRFTDFLIPEGAITATWSFALMSSPANADRDCDTVQAQV